jgi:hypothetical protein
VFVDLMAVFFGSGEVKQSRNVAGQKFAERNILITGFRHTEYLMRTASMTPGIYFLTVFGKTIRK